MDKVRLFCVPVILLLVLSLCGCSGSTEKMQDGLIDCASDAIDGIASDYTVTVIEPNDSDGQTYYVAVNIHGLTGKPYFYAAQTARMLDMYDARLYRAYGVDVPDGVTVITQAFDGETRIDLTEHEDDTYSLYYVRSEDDVETVFQNLTWEEINIPWIGSSAEN